MSSRRPYSVTLSCGHDAIFCGRGWCRRLDCIACNKVPCPRCKRVERIVQWRDQETTKEAA